MNVFISHASADLPLAVRVERALKRRGMQVWLDQSSIRVGALLRRELRSAIQASDVAVLLWSRPASASRWVKAEIVMAFHSDRFIVPLARDATRFPYFLQNTVHLDVAAGARWTARMRRAVEGAPRGPNPLPPFIATPTEQVERFVRSINRRQHELFDRLDRGDPVGAARMHEDAGKELATASKAWPHELSLLKLAGYHHKNAYMLKHDARIRAGQPPASDALLARAERCFFQALFVDPNDHEALNGLGSVLIYERDHEAAKFFIERAIALARRRGVRYAEAEEDLRLVERALGDTAGGHEREPTQREPTQREST